jgi:von Willebrand factor type A domain
MMLRSQLDHFFKPAIKTFSRRSFKFTSQFISRKKMPAWLTLLGVKYFGWSVSLMIHLIVLLTGLMVYSILRGPAPPPPLIAPESFFNGANPTLQPDDGRSVLDAMSQKHPLPAQEWTVHPEQTVLNQILDGPTGLNNNSVIGLGAPGGGLGQTAGGGGLGPLGIPGGSVAAGPGISFLDVHSRADSTVIIVDTSGSMIDGWEFVKSEVKSTIQSMRPYQKFAVIVFSDHDQILGPNQLVRATAAARQDIYNRLDNVAPQGHNDDMLIPFLTPFQAAFAMHPQSIYFLTDGNFDFRLIQSVADLYAGEHIPVYAFAYLDDPDDATADSDSIVKLKQIASETNGEFHAISENVLQQSQ